MTKADQEIAHVITADQEIAHVITAAKFARRCARNWREYLRLLDDNLSWFQSLRVDRP